MYGTLDIKGKELPEDFFTYFDKNGEGLECPYDVDDEQLDDWIDRKKEIAFMFMSDEQKKEFRLMERNWTSKVESSFGIES